MQSCPAASMTSDFKSACNSSIRKVQPRQDISYSTCATFPTTALVREGDGVHVE